MRFADVCVMLSFLVIVAVIARMLRAIRLLDGRVSLLQEEVEQNRNLMRKATGGRPATVKMVPSRTPVEGVSVGAAAGIAQRAPAPILVENRASEDKHALGEPAAYVVDQVEAEAIWAHLAAEQERLKRAMGRDFQVNTVKRSATGVRGKPIVRALSPQEVAKKLEGK